MKGCLLILRRDFARSDSHDNMTFYYEGLVDDFGFAAYSVLYSSYRGEFNTASARAERRCSLRKYWLKILENEMY